MTYFPPPGTPNKSNLPPLLIRATDAIGPLAGNTDDPARYPVVDLRGNGQAPFFHNAVLENAVTRGIDSLKGKVKYNPYFGKDGLAQFKALFRSYAATYYHERKGYAFVTREECREKYPDIYKIVVENEKSSR